MSQFDDPSGAMPPMDDDPAERPLGKAPGEAPRAGTDPVPGPESDPEKGRPAAAEEAPPVDPPGRGGGLPPEASGQVGPPAPTPVPQECLARPVIVYWLISGLIGWVFTTGFVAAGTAFVYFKWPEFRVYVLVAALVLVILQLVWVLIAPSLAYTRWRFLVDGELLLMRYGILFIEEKAIPISRLQHVDLYRGLLERFLGLTTLIVFTAGTEGAHFRLPGLTVQRAQQLRDVILAARGDDVI